MGSTGHSRGPLYNALVKLDVNRQRGPGPRLLAVTKGDPLYTALVKLDVDGQCWPKPRLLAVTDAVVRELHRRLHAVNHRRAGSVELSHLGDASPTRALARRQYRGVVPTSGHCRRQTKTIQL